MVGVEPNEFMDQYSTEKAASLGLQLDVRRGRGEALPLGDARCGVSDDSTGRKHAS